MNPQTTAGATIYVVANIDGHLWRIQAVRQFILGDASLLPPPERRVVVHMGNYEQTWNDAVMEPSAWDGFDLHFLRGEDEETYFQKIAETNSTIQEIESKTGQPGNARYMRAFRNELLRKYKGPHRSLWMGLVRLISKAIICFPLASTLYHWKNSVF